MDLRIGKREGGQNHSQPCTRERYQPGYRKLAKNKMKKRIATHFISGVKRSKGESNLYGGGGRKRR